MEVPQLPGHNQDDSSSAFASLLAGLRGAPQWELPASREVPLDEEEVEEARVSSPHGLRWAAESGDGAPAWGLRAMHRGSQRQSAAPRWAPPAMRCSSDSCQYDTLGMSTLLAGLPASTNARLRSRFGSCRSAPASVAHCAPAAAWTWPQGQPSAAKALSPSPPAHEANADWTHPEAISVDEAPYRPRAAAEGRSKAGAEVASLLPTCTWFIPASGSCNESLCSVAPEPPLHLRAAVSMGSISTWPQGLGSVPAASSGLREAMSSEPWWMSSGERTSAGRRQRGGVDLQSLLVPVNSGPESFVLPSRCGVPDCIRFRAASMVVEGTAKN